MTEYTPSIEEVRRRYMHCRDTSYEADGPIYADAVAAFDRFIAKIKADALRFGAVELESVLRAHGVLEPGIASLEGSMLRQMADELEDKA